MLDAAGAADRELFHFGLSRMSHEFLLLIDDHEALIDLPESRPGMEDGTLAVDRRADSPPIGALTC